VFNFPSSPSVGQEFTSGGIYYTWNGYGWALKAETDASEVVLKVGDTMIGHLSLPTGPAAANAVRKDYVDAAVAAVPAPVAATAAEYRANSAPTKMLTPGAVWGAAAGVTLTDAAGVYTPDFSAGLDFSISLFGAKTIANPTNTKNGQKGIILIVSGNSAAAITWGTAYKFPGGIKPVISAVPGAYDVLSYFVYSSTHIFCTFSADFK